MRIRNILLILLGVQLCLVGGLILTALQMQATQTLTENAEQQRLTSLLLADELRQSSDDLTRFARTYVTTGDDRYEDYFNQVLAIRNGDVRRPDGYEGIYWDMVVADSDYKIALGQQISLRDRMLAAGFTNKEFDKLSESQSMSDALVRLESVAINAMKGRYDDGTGTFGLTGVPDPQRAVKLLHGPEYHTAKAKIMKPIAEFMAMIDTRTTNKVAGLNELSRDLEQFNVILAVTLLLTTLVSLLLIRSRVLRPIEAMVATATKVSAGELTARAPVQHSGEIATFGNAFNEMVASVEKHVSDLNAVQEELHSKAENLKEEKHRSEKLLLNILPAQIAERLKGGDTDIADSFPEVSVLFSDIVGFTEMSARIGARQVVDTLNEVFGVLDKLALKHNVEKIKTIGDCYMVVAGVPDRSPTHAQQIAEFALDMQIALSDYAISSGRDITMRTGIHTGTAVAGIVGTSKFAYDLWGDVVNVASRMEATSEPGQIHVSSAVKIRLEDDYIFEERGATTLKGKGELNTFYLTDRRTANH